MIELIKIQTELKAPKSKLNKFGGFAYRSAEDILEAAKPLLAKYGCLLTLSEELLQLGDRIFVKAVAEFTAPDGKTKTVTAYAEHPKEKKGMDASQVTGSASSYARKYALGGLLLIDDESDADGLPPQNAAKPPVIQPPPMPGANGAFGQARPPMPPPLPKR